LHPVDFTFLARIRVHPAYRHHFSLTESATLPPLELPNGGYVIARSTHLAGLDANGQPVWQFDTLGSVTGMIALPDGRVLVASSAGQVLVLDNGSYNALWQTPQTFITPPILLGHAVVFMTEDRTLVALTPEGNPLWETEPLPERASRWAISGDRLALATHSNDLWVVDATGTVLYQATYPDMPVPFAAPDEEFWLLSDSTVLHINRALAITPLLDTGHEFTPEAELLGDKSGPLYLYPGEGRSLYAYQPDGTLLWIAYMPGSHLRAPRLGLGGGRLIYALTTDGQLLAYTTGDGRLVAQQALYNGGIDGSASARWLEVKPDDTVSFSSGYLSVVTLNGLDLIADDSADQN
jgi:outer membrane protein assembly factor BamB